jgi:Uma2 family endonuclease
MIDALAEEMRINIASYGSMTFKRKAKQKGLEPDECYWVQHELDVRGRDEITLHNAPPPDLVLEVEVSRSMLSRIGIYAAFGVPEVWRCRQKAIRVVRLVEGKYQTSERSGAFPFLNPTALLPFLNQPADVSEVEMILRFRDWVRLQIAAGWPNGGE